MQLVVVSALVIDESRVDSGNCLGLSIRTECVEDVSSQDFSVSLVYVNGRCQTVDDLPNRSATETIASPSGVCIPVGTSSNVELCYRATLMYQGTVVDTKANSVRRSCPVCSLDDLLGPDAVHDLVPGMVPHSTLAMLSCRLGYTFSGVSEALCTDGTWIMSGPISCTCELCM